MEQLDNLLGARIYSSEGAALVRGAPYQPRFLVRPETLESRMT